jgi:hypothetical protein
MFYILFHFIVQNSKKLLNWKVTKRAKASEFLQLSFTISSSEELFWIFYQKIKEKIIQNHYNSQMMIALSDACTTNFLYECKWHFLDHNLWLESGALNCDFIH